MTPPASPRFTVLVPTHNRADLLPRALRSVLSQSFSDFELLVVDDASTDATQQTVAAIADPRIVYHRRQVNGGAAAARNTGIDLARGELLALLDDDDEYLPGFLEETERTYSEAGPDVGLTWCGVIWVRDTAAGEIVLHEDLWHPRYADREAAYRAFLRNRRVGTNCGLTFRRSALSTMPLFDESLRGGAEDTDFLIRFVRSFEFVVIDSMLVRVHLHGGPNLRSNTARKAGDYEQILAKHRAALEADPRLWAALHYKTGWLHYHGGDRAAGRRHLLSALARRPLHLKSWAGLALFESCGRWAPAIHRRLSRLARPGRQPAG